MKQIIVLLLLWNGFFLALTAQNHQWRNLRKGNKAFTTQQYKTAEQIYLEVLRQEPQNTRTRFNLGDTYLAQNKTKEAMAQYEKVAQVESNKLLRSMAHHNMGYIQHQNKQYDKAIAAYKMALRYNPNDEDTRYNLALAQNQKKQQQKDQQQQKQQKDPQKQQQSQQGQQRTDEQNLEKENADALLHMARQAEQQTMQKLKKLRPLRTKQMEKNW